MNAISNSKREASRLRALRACNVVDTPPDPEFNRLVFIAAQYFRVPAAAITFVDASISWVKAKVGFTISSVQREQSFASAVIERAHLTIIDDLGAISPYRRNPVVLGEPFVRFCAGVPILGPSDERVGAFLVMDRAARGLATEQAVLLTKLAEETSALIMRRVVDEDRTMARTAGVAAAAVA